MTDKRDVAVRRAQALAPSFADRIGETLCSGDFWKPLGFVGSENRLTMLRAIWSLAPSSERAPLLAWSIANGDAPHRELAFICRAMRECRRRGALLLAGPEDRSFLDGLLERIVVFRGTTQAELDDSPFFGVSWTTERDRAEWFAAEHGRFRRVDSPPIVMSQTVSKDDVAGAVNGRDEREVFIDPSTTCLAQREGRLTASDVRRRIV